MSRRPRCAARALDLVNFFVADVQTGFGPFVAVYLTTHKWTQVQIGFALTLGTIVALISQLPAGVLGGRRAQQAVAGGGALLGVIAAALLLAIRPTQLPVLVAQMLHAFASCVLTPAIAAISLHLVGHAALGERLGRNARFASIGNGLAAAVMGATGAYLSSRSVFMLTAALCVPALWRCWRDRARPACQAADHDHAVRLAGPAAIVQPTADCSSSRAAWCCSTCRTPRCCRWSARRSRCAPADFANLIIAACIVVPQAVVALCSPWVGRGAPTLGRATPLLLLGWAALPLRGLLLAVLPGPWLPIAARR